MKTRIITALIGLPLFVAAVLLLPMWAFGLLIAFLCAGASFELLRCAIGEAPKRLYFSTGIPAALIPVFFALGLELRWIVAVMLLLFFVLSCEMMALFATPRRISLEMVGISMLAATVLPLMLSMLCRIRLSESVGRVQVLLPFVVAFSSDAGAYFAGHLWGKHPMAPHISPKKTREGGVGGIVTGILFSVGYGAVLHAIGYEVNTLSLALFGLFGSGVAQLGDLTFSAFKRQYKIKDYGTILPGHGGILDRFDSMYYLAPLTELWLLLFPAIW